MNRIQIILIISSVILLIIVLELVRRRQLREEYSMLWLLTGFGYAILAFFPAISSTLSGFLQIDRPLSLFTPAGIIFLSLICIQFSVRLSKLTNRNKHLAQQVAILDSELREFKNKGRQDKVRDYHQGEYIETNNN